MPTRDPPNEPGPGGAGPQLQSRKAGVGVTQGRAGLGGPKTQADTAGKSGHGSRRTGSGHTESHGLLTYRFSSAGRTAARLGSSAPAAGAPV